MRKVTIPIEEWIKLIESGVYTPAQVIPRGNSMWPLIRGGRDTITVKPLDRNWDICSQLKIGDIIVFRRADGTYVVHRIWKFLPASAIASQRSASPQPHNQTYASTDSASASCMIQTYGDNCLQPDAPIKPEAVCGIVTMIHRGGKDIDPSARTATIIGTANRSLSGIRRGLSQIKHRIKDRIYQGQSVSSK